MKGTLHSLLVNEETDDYITLRAAFDGSIWKALGFLFTTWRMNWFPYRTGPVRIEDEEIIFEKSGWNAPRRFQKQVSA